MVFRNPRWKRCSKPCSQRVSVWEVVHHIIPTHRRSSDRPAPIMVLAEERWISLWLGAGTVNNVLSKFKGPLLGFEKPTAFLKPTQYGSLAFPTVRRLRTRCSFLGRQGTWGPQTQTQSMFLGLYVSHIVRTSTHASLHVHLYFEQIGMALWKRHAYIVNIIIVFDVPHQTVSYMRGHWEC